MNEPSLLVRVGMVSATIVTLSSLSAETHKFDPSVGHQTYMVREPVLTVRPGDSVETRTLHSGLFDGDGSAWPGEVGPIFVEGATVNDTLVVRIDRLRVNHDKGFSGTSQGFAALTATTNFTPMLHEPVPEKRHVWDIDVDANTASLDLPLSKLRRVTVELIPMLGRLAVAPDHDEAIWGATPGNFGGNMDSSDAREGTTVYLPIFVDGAYFYFGDVHALQGDGEITGTGIETGADVTFTFDLIKGKTISWPRFEDDAHIMVAGSVRPLIDAYRVAHVEMIYWLESEYGFDRWEAVQLFSQVGVARIANVVDPNFTVMAKFPKKYLPDPE